MPLLGSLSTRSTNKVAVLIALCFSVFVVNVATMIVNIALPVMVVELDASTRDLLWIVDAFNLTFAALVLAAGSLSDRFGRRAFLLGGLAVSVVASTAGAWSPNPEVLIGWRALAGVAAAVVYPVTLSILTNVFTERSERVKAIGIWGAATGMSVAIGPVVGGALIESFWWGSILVFVGAASLATLAMAAVVVPESRDPSVPPLDFLGLLLSTLALGSLVYTIIEAPDRGWTATATLVGFAAAAVLLIVFVLQEVRVPHPMLDVRLFTNMRFTAASGAITGAFFALFGFIFLVTQYLQSVLGYGALETGLRMLPVAGSIAVASLVGPRLAVAIGTKIVVAAGLMMVTVMFWWSATSQVDTSYSIIASQMVLLGIGLGLISAPATEAIMGAVSTEKAGMGSAVNDATREFGGTLGVAVIGSIALSVYRDALETDAKSIPAQLIEPARDSIGAALEASKIAAAQFGEVGAVAGQQLSGIARSGFVDGFTTGCIVAGAVTAVAAILTLIFLPAHPGTTEYENPAGDLDEQSKASASEEKSSSRR
ncbi:MAG: MFS transporter [Rhodococcus sp. (in: high G+C Gram-positive bacteria)]|uniref:MFS transporter n=1 Tax=Rhodococcus sp. TaxID=1831 RepID=UPI002AD9C5EB|nr:MFS transporter [Rhodococcus sp. (in: high G+C Gram-positive bacteria)]